MPSISAAELDRLHQQLRDAREEVTHKTEAYLSLNDAYKTEFGKRQDFDKVLDEIVREARGANGAGMGFSNSFTPSYGQPCPCHQPQPTDAERHEQAIAIQAERIVGLEKCLAAVVAVATFAKHDKSKF